MTIDEAITVLERCGYAWLLSSGRLTNDEPSYGIALFALDAQGLSNEEPAFIVQGDSIISCVVKTLVWARKLPELSWAPNGDTAVLIKAGESGYFPTDTPVPASEVQRLNAKLGVTVQQAAAMLNGSLFGWHVPAADPANYLDTGELKAGRADA